MIELRDYQKRIVKEGLGIINMQTKKILDHMDMRYTYVNGYERLYRLYSDGEIWSVRSAKFISQELVKGYNRVSLSLNGKVKRFQVHRLVAEHFILNPNKKPCVNHKNGDKQDNNILNLEWCTYSENEKHSYNELGKINNNRKLSNDDILDIRLNAIKGINQSNRGNVIDYATKYNVNTSTILNVLKNKYYV
jgi:hypothetical protein